MKLVNRLWISALLIASSVGLFVLQQARSQEPPPPAQDLERVLGKKPSYSKYADRQFAMRVYWGDTHLHTSQSFDAIAFGCTLGPEDAYRFARGEQVTSSTGQRARLSRPLDFLVVSDHAENMGSLGEIKEGNPVLMNDPLLRRWHDMLNGGGKEAMQVYYEIADAIGKGKALPAALVAPELARSVWEKNLSAAEKFNDPGRFTALIGYEWSSNTGGNNLHRVVIFRGGADKATQVLPFSSLTSDNPEDLWKALRSYQDKTGDQVLAIPHNGNLSNGLMFPLVNPIGGKPLTREYAQTRASFEPLLEATQIKGDGETHPFLSPNDEFANYERWDKGNLDLSAGKKPEMLQYEYARSALRNGLKLERELGVNPYKYGMVGSTDAHTGLTAVEEENFFGKLPHAEPSAERATHAMAKFGEKEYMGWEMTSSGYAGVWAADNTREALWDAMKRKEVYATTGPRMIVRFFGSWDFGPGDANTRNPAVAGYTKGVPMGGDLSNVPAGKSPTFLVAALKDPIGANLDRIQIVKGWLDAKNETHERIYDVAWSGDRKADPKTSKLPAVGDTVDVTNATFTNTIGASELIKVWKDPQFDPAQRAFYYVRVLEIPTPRWTAYDAKYYGVTMPPEVPMKGQERAYTSPIWYTPPAR
jgi:hypothetical protein